MTKDQIIDSAIEEFDKKFPLDLELNKEISVPSEYGGATRFVDARKDIKSFLRTKLEGIVFSRGEVEKLLYSLKYENTDKIVYEKRIYSDENLVNKIAKEITAQQAKHRDK
jgi:hypothetical protein